MPAVHVGRQPVYDRSMDVVGYELLFRAQTTSTSAERSDDFATTRVIVNTFMEFGLERLVGRRLAFVNLTRPFVVGELPVPFTPEKAVLELLETIPADAEVVEGARRLREQGYSIALDDWSVQQEHRMALLDVADIVKVDVKDAAPEELERRVHALRSSHDVTLVAERVETATDMDLCHRLGFDWFQGYFLLRPDVVSARTVSPAHLACLRLLGRLADPEVDLGEIEEVVRADLGLNYRILRAANAASSGTIRRIESIRDALVLLGMATLRSWMLLMVLSDASDPDSEQLSAAMTRARTCELVARHTGDVRPESAFMVGLLSSLDQLLGLSMPLVVDRLPLAEDLQAALLRREGRLGEILSTVAGLEDLDDAAVAAGLDALPISADELVRSYLGAVSWTAMTTDDALGATRSAPAGARA
ncbi:diguanylate phosphodiesterase [Motilibacter rhizosphaerae]|uniref:Diguanylate phosphodiesterase n=1 Tax=Motilibacter rhizosphaerae TaxID=598652 RepID=A0A4Q7NRZ3_9ACTN|nr:HDOD domain-containing protein [Motilibacter rhizosphaerae]RZS89765.1 diguanylate phosphodiesterase [Motilibacter rhizosphaerae]